MCRGAGTTPWRAAVSGADATPTGVVVYQGPPHTPGWFEARAGGVTATAVADIAVPSRYGSALTVWARLAGHELRDEQSEAAWWGLRDEAGIAERWSLLHEVDVVETGVLRHRDIAHHRASPDRVVPQCPGLPADSAGPCLLQIKCRSLRVEPRWADGPPSHELAQVQWEMHVTGVDHTHLAVRFDGNRLREWRVERDDARIAQLVWLADDVWARAHDGRPPLVDLRPEDNELLRRIWPSPAGVAEWTPGQAEALLANLADAQAAKRDSTAELELAQAAIRLALAGAGEAQVGGRTVLRLVETTRQYRAQPARDAYTTTAHRIDVIGAP